MILRPYQHAADEAVNRQWDAGVRSTLIELPTGTGKTVVMAKIARDVVERGGRVLGVAHRTELLRQMQRKMLDAGVHAELEQGRHRAGRAPVVIASVQSLKGRRLADAELHDYDAVLLDEAHHAVAPGYLAILDAATRAKVLGVTATGDRADGSALGKVFESVAYQLGIRESIRDGWLVPLVAKRIVLEGVDLSAVKTRAGDLAQDQLGAILREEEALHSVVVPLLEQSAGRRTIVFGVDVAHAHALADLLNRYEPGCARAIDGSADEDERDHVLADFRSGAFRILVNCALFTEGFDEPSIACVAIVRPTRSRALYVQMVGRGTRPLAPPMELTAAERIAAIAASAKPNVLILDFTGNAGRHPLVGPADVLAGRALDDETTAELKKLLDTGEQFELEALLDHADNEVRDRREKAGPLAVARYLAESFDPFVGPAQDAAATPKPSAWHHMPATSGQLRALKRFGIDKVPEALTMADASRMIDVCTRRDELGLCSIGQARLIGQQHKIDASHMSKVDAGKAIASLRNRWSAIKSYRRSA